MTDRGWWGRGWGQWKTGRLYDRPRVVGEGWVNGKQVRLYDRPAVVGEGMGALENRYGCMTDQ